VDEDGDLTWTSQDQQGGAIEDLLSVAEGRRRGQEWVLEAYDALVADVRAARRYEQARELAALLRETDIDHFDGKFVSRYIALLDLLSEETD
jgi:hypothetical protein